MSGVSEEPVCLELSGGERKADRNLAGCLLGGP